MCAEWRAGSEFTLERKILILKGLCWCFPGQSSWGLGFPGKLGLLVHREATGCRMLCPNPRGAGCKSGSSLLGKPQGIALAPLESVGVLHLLSRYKQCQGKLQVWNCWKGKDCKQHPNNPWERIHSLGPAQCWNQHPQDVSSLAAALSAWTNHPHRETLPSGHSLVGRSSLSCSRRSVCCLLHQTVKELEAAELMGADKVRALAVSGDKANGGRHLEEQRDGARHGSSWQTLSSSSPLQMGRFPSTQGVGHSPGLPLKEGWHTAQMCHGGPATRL